MISNFRDTTKDEVCWCGRERGRNEKGRGLKNVNEEEVLKTVQKLKRGKSVELDEGIDKGGGIYPFRRKFQPQKSEMEEFWNI